MFTINEAAPLVLSDSITIDAAPEDVFATMADLAAWPTWQGNVSRVQFASEVAEGVDFRWRAGGVTIASTVGLFEPPSALGWTGRMLGTTAAHLWRFDREAAGTRVETRESAQGWLLSLPWLKGFMRKSLRDGMSVALAELKTEAERRAGASRTNG